MKTSVVAAVILLITLPKAAFFIAVEGKFFQPHFNPDRDVNFYLFTRRNPNLGQRVVLWDDQSLLQSNFNISNPTRFFIHGWNSDSETFLNVDGTAAYMIHGEFNVIRVDWSRGAQTWNLVRATNRVDPTGRTVGSFIDFLNEVIGMRFEDLTLVGFSLGAHVAGFAGKNVRRGRINTIIGLDPGGPLFSVRDPSSRLSSNDAEYVEVIHTNAGATGIGFPIGHVDFYPNSGSQQPGCITNFCAHDRAPLFFIESINSNDFYAHRCELSSDIGRGCRGEPLATMGGEPSNAGRNIRGIFHLTTNRSPPYSQGRP